MNDVLKNIRNNNMKRVFLLLIPTAIFSLFFIFILIGMFTQDEFHFWYLIVVAVFGLFAYSFFSEFVKSFKLMIEPTKDDVFKKYGSPEKVEKIINEIEKSIIYEDDHLVISKNYISDKKDYSKIVKCDDVLGVHKLVHKTNYVVDYYQIVITDKYNQEMTYKYKRGEEEVVNQLLVIIGSKCPNAELGFTKKQWNHIKANAIKLPDDKEEKEVTYKCDNCGAVVKDSDKKCPKCGELFESDEEIIESSEDSDMDKKYSDLNKLKDLLDKNIITKVEFEKEKKKILK